MSRCKHPECTVFEIVKTKRQFHFVDGHLDVYDSRHLPKPVRIGVECHSCGLVRSYSGPLPAWVAKLTEAIPPELRQSE